MSGYTTDREVYAEEVDKMETNRREGSRPKASKSDKSTLTHYSFSISPEVRVFLLNRRRYFRELFDDDSHRSSSDIE